MIPRLVGLVAVLLLLWRSALAQSEPNRRTALLDADRAAAELSRDSGFSVALRRNLDTAGVLLWPGAPVLIGSAEVMRFRAMVPSGDSLQLTWQPLGVFLDRDSVTGVTWGVAIASGAAVSPSPTIGRYISAWQREAARWKLSALMLTPAPAADLSHLPQEITLTRGRASHVQRTAEYVDADIAFARLAAKQGAGVAFREWAAPEAVIFGGSGVLIRGPAPIAQAVSGPEQWEWHPVAAGGAANGDLGWTAGEAVISEKEGVRHSKYLTIWRRMADGRLRFLIDGGNSRPAPQP